MRAVVALGVAAAALGACGEASPAAAPPVGTPSVSASTPAPSTPSTTVPSTTTPALPDGIPAAATRRTQEGAEAFVRHYLDQVNVAWTTPKTGLLPPLSGPDCKSCAAFEASADRLVTKHLRYRSDPATVTALTPGGQTPATDEAPFRIYATVVQNRVDILDAEGKVVETDDRKVHTFLFTLTFADAAWRATNIQPVK